MFLANPSEQSYEQVVDYLLGSILTVSIGHVARSR